MSRDQLEKRQITYDLSGPAGSIFRVQGIYRARFELSSLAIAYDGRLDDLDSPYFQDFCIGVSDSCYRELDRATKAKGRFRDRLSEFGLIDAVVRFKSPTGTDCPFGNITIVNLVSAHSIPATAVFGKPLHVEVRRNGDDGLTLRFADALEAAFHDSELLTLIGDKQPGALAVTISRNVEWTRVRHRTRMSYSIELTGEGARRIGERRGFCWEDELAKCAQRIANEVEISATKQLWR